MSNIADKHKVEVREKKPRRISVKNASFYLYKRDEGCLSPMGNFETEAEIRKAYETALDNGSSEEELVGIKGRFLEFKVTEKKRKVRVV